MTKTSVEKYTVVPFVSETEQLNNLLASSKCENPLFTEEFKRLATVWLSDRKKDLDEWLVWWQKEFDSKEVPASYENTNFLLEKLLSILK